MDNPYDWIIKYVEQPQYLPVQVAQLFPSTYERYFVIENNYGIIESFPFSEYPKDTSNINDLNKRHAIERQFGLFLNNSREDLYQHKSIRDLAIYFNVEYYANTVDQISSTPGVGLLNNKTKEVFGRLIDELISGWVAYQYINGIVLPEDEGSFQTKRTVTQSKNYVSIGESKALDHCSYLFPDSLEWCLLESEDIQHPILACSERIASKLSKVKDLEYFDIRPETDINTL